MKKNVLISSILLILSTSSLTHAQEMLIIEDDEDEAPVEAIKLDAVEVTSKANSAEEMMKTGARPPFAQTIQLPQLQSINDWLESANGVYGDASGKGTRSVIVRGFETRQINFEFDGVPLDTGYDGMTGMDVMPMNWISAGRIAHADATPTDGVGLGGKIDFYALDPGILEASVENSLTGFIGSIAHGMKYKQWRWAVTGGGQYSPGFYLSRNFEPSADEDGDWRDSSERYGGNVFFKVGRELGHWGDLEVMSGYSNAPRGVPTGVDTGYRRYWRFTNWRVAFASARLRFHSNVLNGSVQIWATNQGNTLKAYDDASRTTQTRETASTSIWNDDDYGGRIELSSQPWNLHAAGFMRLLLRSDFRYQYHESNEMTYLGKPDVYKDSSRFYYQVRPALEWQILPDLRIFASGYAEGAKPISQAAENTSNDIQLEELNNGGFSAGLDYKILNNLDFNLRAARRLRMPTLKEQFRNIPELDEEVPTLKPEVAWDFEAEIHYKPIDTVALTIGVFDTEIHDLIEFKYISGYKISYNVSESRIAGTDIALALGPWFGISGEISYHYLYAYDLSQEHELNDRPAHNLRFAAHYAPIENLKFTLGGQFESKRRTEAWLTTHYAWMGNVFLLHAEIEWQIEHFSLYLRGTNLADYNYSRAFGYPEPGFNLTLGAKVSL